MNTGFRCDLRQASGRDPEPSAGAIDSQSQMFVARDDMGKP